MSGTKKTQLYELIARMTASEKRYFKVNSHWKSSDKDYLNLFEYLEKQKRISEEALDIYMAAKGFSGQLHVCKNYLQQLILKSLRSFHAKTSKDAELKDRLRNIEILYRKELYGHCLEEITRAEKLAKKYQANLMLIDILSWKRRLILSWKPENIAEVRQVLDEEIEALNSQQEVLQHWDLMLKIQNVSRDEAQQCLKHPLLEEDREIKLLQTSVFADQIRYQLKIVSGDGQNAAKVLQNSLKKMESFPHRVKESPGAYINALNNLLSYFVYNKNFDEVHLLLKKVKQVAETFGIQKKDKLFLKLQLRSYNIELEMYRDTKELHKASVFIDELKLFMENSRKNIPDSYSLLFWFQFANVYFMKADLSAALKQVNLIMEARFRTLRKDIDLYSRWLNLFIHLEMKNYMVLRYYMDSVKRFAKKIQQMDAQEKCLLRTMIELSQTDEKDHPQLYKKLYHELFETKLEKNNQNVLDYIDVRFWLEGKLK